MSTPATSLFVNRLNGLTRIAVMRHDRLIHLGLHAATDLGNPGDIFLGKVTKVIPGINAAFLDLGEGHNAFLNRADIPLPIAKSGGADMASIVKPGQTLPVQVKRIASGEKLTQVSAELKLVGFSGILVVGGKGVSFSKRFKGDREECQFEELLNDGEDLGYIVRSGAEKMKPQLRSLEFKSLVEDYIQLRESVDNSGKPRLLRKHCPVKACLIDFWKDGLRSIFFDNETMFQTWEASLKKEHPQLSTALKFHDEPFPMFDLYKIESEIKKAMAERVWLKSGGYFDVRHTEAMITVDVNSGKDMRLGSGKSAGMRANLEATYEIARHARIRNLAGLVVIDFINGKGSAWLKQLDDSLKKAFRGDPARVDLIPVNHFGLAQISRERLGPDLNSQIREKCHVCKGVGWIKTPETAAFELELQLTRELGGSPGETVLVTCGRRLSSVLSLERIQAWEKQFQAKIQTKISERISQLGFELTLVD